jgi:AcrR family transcriptional regulator
MTRKNNSNTRSRSPLSKERVLRCAVRLADKEGIEGLSMRKLAQALDVKAMSLYNHVENKDDIIDGIVDRVVSEIEVPSLNVHWKVAMRSRAISAHEVLLRHPWATMPMVSRINVGPAMLRYTDATLGCLLEAGFSSEIADRAWNALDSHIYGFTLQELNFPVETEAYATTAAEYLPMIPADNYPYMNRLSQQVAEGQYDGINKFEFGLDLILDGLDAYRT